MVNSLCSMCLSCLGWLCSMCLISVRFVSLSSKELNTYVSKQTGFEPNTNTCVTNQTGLSGDVNTIY